MFKVRMKDRDLTIKVKKAFALCMRDKAQMQADSYGRLFVANSVTLATRVRTDILKAIAQRCSNGREDLVLLWGSPPGRSSRSCRRRDFSGHYTLTYADA